MESRGTFASSSRVNPNRKVDKEGTMLNKLFGGKRVDGEYRPGLGDRKIFGGEGVRNMKKQGVVMEGDTQRAIDKKRRQRKRSGHRDDLLAKKGMFLKKRRRTIPGAGGKTDIFGRPSTWAVRSGGGGIDLSNLNINFPNISFDWLLSSDYDLPRKDSYGTQGGIFADKGAEVGDAIKNVSEIKLPPIKKPNISANVDTNIGPKITSRKELASKKKMLKKQEFDKKMKQGSGSGTIDVTKKEKQMEAMSRSNPVGSMVVGTKAIYDKIKGEDGAFVFKFKKKKKR